jgi:DNA-directed RNA polymerase subunit RPC12/RpoP
MSKDTVMACPDCDNASITILSPGSPSGSDAPANYYCPDCSSYFDEPNRRQKRASTRPNKSTIAGELYDAPHPYESE